MRSSLHRLLAGAVVLGVLALVPLPPLTAQTGTAFRINDRGKFFSKEAVEKAEKKIEQIKRLYRKDLLIETYAEPPERVAEDIRKAEGDKEKNEVLSNWTKQRYNSERVEGIYVVVVRKPEKLRVRVGDRTAKMAFTQADSKELFNTMTARFKEGKFDAGLLAGVDFVESTLDRKVGKAVTKETPGRNAVTGTKSGERADNVNPIWGWLCIGVVVLLGLWLVFGLIRAFSGGGGGGGGGGPAGPGGYGGGGGGGFFSSLLGGMFGAAAGMWMYDSFFRSTPPSTGGFGGSAYAGSPDAGDASTGGDAGGDWGGGSTGGDTGGGGDWGGGGDAGGGGDWGGGGGDTGGGDWGGGGGDWGGGGGDSGGGDW